MIGSINRFIFNPLFELVLNKKCGDIDLKAILVPV
jgi:hypothetical protein